ncbi:HAMP domain-containing sensor histidine kinase [Nocardioides sp. BP30]|uniref:sensor histidine kinase n=1 Tax=Nocardioides sp. BP30 TaxID=3036374 RepID=UPI0024683E81|nr:HAMP domain-containing sensor histidine kinase [Nocardioides sp. BP30]WGL52403.1 HAMP domain-containing sensor histidine kinase [Nocardioides sp. BP30]
MLRLRPRGFRTQIVASTVLLMAFVMVVLTAGTQAVLEWNTHNDVRRVLDERTQAVLPIVRATSKPLGEQSWESIEPLSRVYDAHGAPVGGSIQHIAESDAAALAIKALATGQRQEAEAHDNLNLRAAPFTTRSGERGAVVVSESSDPYERTELEALIAMIVLGLLVVGVAGIIAWRVTRQALEPVEQMAERAADWSEHDLSHRFDLGTPDNELSKLGETLDHLLDRVAAAIRAEQRLTAELAHELRTPLTTIQGAADLALLRGVADEDAREDLEAISAAARRMTGVIATLLDLARERGASAKASTSLAAVVDALRPLVPDHLELVDEVSETTVPVAAPATLVVQAVSPIVENAVRYARSTVRFEARATPDQVHLLVTDDGPGLAATVRDRVFEPGTSGSGGTGLGLGISRRVARSLGGEVDVVEAADGATFVVRLPRR